jgi:hypothetical protein
LDKLVINWDESVRKIAENSRKKVRPFTINFEPELFDSIRQLAAVNKCSMTRIIHIVLEDFIREAKKPQEGS